jgi:hypothetical protein
MKKPALFAFTAVCLFAADLAVEGKLWWAHIEYLANDKLEGRAIGTPGFEKAVAYVQSEFGRLKLKPAGTSGYLQPVKFESRTLMPEQSSLALVRDGEVEGLALGQDANIAVRPGLVPSVEAPLVFVGYGMSVPEAKYDDLAGVNVRGRIAVYVSSPGPAQMTDNMRSHYSSSAERWAMLKKAGAVGSAAIAIARAPAATGAARGAAGDTAAGGAARGAAGAGGGRGAGTPQPVISLADPNLQDSEGQKIAINITRRGAENFFAGSGHTWEELDALARENRPLPRFPLAPTLRATATVKRDTLEAPNLVGIFPGSDARLKDEYVILSAHLDHLGVRRGGAGDTINNGAMDDASGIASLLEVARLLNGSGTRPKRSIIFLAVCAEEQGELGSRYFIGHPTVPARRIVADINMDMYLPLYALKVLEVQGLTESTLGEQVRAAAKAEGVEVQTDREPEQNRFIRSDQYSFIREGIPSLAFKFGYEFGSPEEKTRREWVNTKYHRPSDDLEQTVDKDAAALFNRVMLGLILRVADDAARPKWNDDSFFGRFAK